MSNYTHAELMAGVEKARTDWHDLACNTFFSTASRCDCSNADRNDHCDDLAATLAFAEELDSAESEYRWITEALRHRVADRLKSWGVLGGDWA